MKRENKTLLVKYLVCVAVASAITVGVFAIKGFFDHTVAVNVQILSDGFSTSGLLMLLYAGMIRISDEGAFIGIGFVLRNVLLSFIPMGRKKQELYADYRERKLAGHKKMSDNCIFVVGAVFFTVGVIFTIIWYTNFYGIT